MSRLLLVRHGRTKLHRGDRFWGKTDIALNDIGIRQAGRLRARLASEKINAVYASTLSRTRFTAEIISSGHKVNVTACDELRECNFGYAEGLTFGEIKRLYPALAKDLNGFGTVARFPGGESFEELDSRVQKFLEKLKTYKPEATVLIVAHASPLQIIICRLMGIPVKHWRQIRLDLASLSIMETYPQGAILSLLNDVSHLKP
jgi:broad specificity phosphatase PhoE